MADGAVYRAARCHGRRASSLLALTSPLRGQVRGPLQVRQLAFPYSRRYRSDEKATYSGFSGSSGARTLENVVRELHERGVKPGQAASGSGFVDIDASLMEDMDMERTYGFGQADIDENEEGEAEEEADEHYEGEEDDSDWRYGHSGMQDTHARHDSYASATVPSGVSARRAVTEDVLHLSEDELKERVRQSIEELVPSSAATGELGSEEELTPAQLFYLENRDSLVQRAQEYYLKKHEEQSRDADDIEDEWRYYHDPVVRPAKGHLWAVDADDGPGLEQGYLEIIQEWPQGRLPSVDMLADLLRAERAQDVVVIDLHACGRHDIGTHAIIATGITTQHCRRLGEIVSKATQSCNPPHVEAFCFGTRNDEWVVAHCGPMKVHLFTRESREQYQLELLWEQPENFFLPGDFPHYIEMNGMATDAFVRDHALGAGDAFSGAFIAGGSAGSRSRALVPPPLRDGLHQALMQPDYDGAEEARFSAPPRVLRSAMPSAQSRTDPEDEFGEATVAASHDYSFRGAEDRHDDLDEGAAAAARAADAYWGSAESLTDDEDDAQDVQAYEDKKSANSRTTLKDEDDDAPFKRL
eukprot:TRINITY_DN24716_c0_g1_i1.p1 TRINITY_DN24716_c0_g1~~TRINITY_DN24716_c0_g1_i1.p1  ORF type:complete len:584 (-),score=88.39 TRINITY_DN24716_c0_g1_i1:125-1876(-)